MTVTITHKARLRRIVKEEVLRVLLREQGNPAQQAQQMGLVKAPGFGNYADPNTGEVTHQSRGGQLVPTEKGKAASSKQSGIQSPRPRAAGEPDPTRGSGGVPQRGLGGTKKPSGITEPPELDPVAGEPGTTPSTDPVRPPRADIPQNQPPAQGEPAQPAQRGGPGIGATPEMPQGPKMPEPPLSKALRKVVDPKKIRMASLTGDTDIIKQSIDAVAVIKDTIAKTKQGQRAIPGIEKLQQHLLKSFGTAQKQKKGFEKFGVGEKPAI